MVELRFDIRPLFPQPIVKISSNLLPHSFRGDRRMAADMTSKISEIIDKLGELSALSQKLSKAVTTAQRLRMNESQTIYLLADAEAGHNGVVIGLLKVGTKSLYLFDESGETKKIDDTPCILDFYIHETRQRAGLGKDLFETMLADKNWNPNQLSIDRPSDKLLGFFKKYYGKEKTIPQTNNFVIFEGFFGSPRTENINQQHANGLHITESPNIALFGLHFIDDDNKKRTRHLDPTSSLSSQKTQISPVGRYAAPRPTCSMAEGMKKESEISLRPSQTSGFEKPNTLKKNPLDAITRPPKIYDYQEKRSGFSATEPHLYNSNTDAHITKMDTCTMIIHSTKKPTTQEVNSNLADDDDIVEEGSTIKSVSEDVQVLQTSQSEQQNSLEFSDEPKLGLQKQNIINNISENLSSEPNNIEAYNVAKNFSQTKNPTSFQLSKQHTGLKNISFNVGMAVTPTNKMEFDQQQTDEFGIIKINRPPGKLVSPPPPDNTDALSNVSAMEGLTDQGYYDLKFYHNKLW